MMSAATSWAAIRGSAVVALYSRGADRPRRGYRQSPAAPNLDITKRPSNALRDAAKEAGLGAALIVPLLSAETSLGALVLQRRQPGEFAPAVITVRSNGKHLLGAGLDDPEPRPVACEPRRDRRKFHKGVAATTREIIERLLDLVVRIDPYARCAMRRN